MARSRRNYRRATEPKDIGVTSITCTPPSPKVRSKRTQLETQWTTNVKRPSLRGGNYMWAMTGPVSRDGNYCIKVKVYNAKVEDYWLPYSLAANLWYDVTGDTLENALREDAGLDPVEPETELDDETAAMLDAICK